MNKERITELLELLTRLRDEPLDDGDRLALLTEVEADVAFALTNAQRAVEGLPPAVRAERKAAR